MSVTATYVKDISIDGTLIPAADGTLHREANMIENPNFINSGDGTNSRMPGLVQWSIDLNGHLSNVQGYKVGLKKSGSTTALTDEPMSLVSGKTYQVTDAAKRVLDPDVAVVVEDNEVAVNAADIDSIDYLFGKVTFDAGYTVNGPVTIASGSYLPMAVIAQNHGAFSLELTAEVMDATDRATAQSNSGYMVNQLGLIDIGASIERFDDLAWTYSDLLEARTPVVLEFSLANGALVCRGWFILGTDDSEGEVSGQENETLEFHLYGQTTVNFAYEATASLNDGLEALLDALWGRSTVTAIYKPDGTNGKSGTAYVASFRIEGDMDTERFSAQLVSGGGLTTVP